MAKHPSGRNRNRRQKLKQTYAKAREDAQLHDVIPTTPEGAVRDERVDPSTQSGTPPLPSFVLRAAQQGWATPDEKKPLIVSELVNIATGGASEIGPDGISTGPSPKTQVYAAKVLAELDQIEYERRNPEQAGRAKGSTNVNVGVGVTNNVFGSIKELIERAREQQSVGKELSDARPERQKVDHSQDVAAGDSAGDERPAEGGSGSDPETG